MTIDETLRLAKVVARNGRVVPAKYLNHPYFDKTSNLCLTLHYAFVRYVPTVAHTHGHATGRAINLFFDYLAEHRAINPAALHPRQYTDISIEIQLGFQDYLLRTGGTPLHAEALKKCANSVARNYGTIPMVMIAHINRRQPKPTEPLSDGAYDALTAALVRHTDKLYQKLEWRKLVDAAIPLSQESVDAHQGPVCKWVPEHTRSLKTLLNHGFPMQLSLEQIYEFTGRPNLTSFTRIRTEVLKAIGHKYIVQSVSGIKLDQLLEMYFPTVIDQCAIGLFLMLQSGWNKETVLSIDGNDFEHILTGSIDDDMAVIFSEKFRSQSNGLPYDAPKQMTASSDKNDKYSIYNLIILAGNLSKPLQGFEFDTDPFQNVGFERNELFLFLRTFGDWYKNGSRHSSINIVNSWQYGIESFLREYEIIDNGRRLTKTGELARRLRSTWLKHKKRTMPMGMISAHFGHSDPSTTDVYYNSSGAAMQERKERLRTELDAVVELLVTGQFRGLLGKRANDQASAAVTLFTIPGHDRPMWGCEDQTSPDWKGHEDQVAHGKRCFRMEKCIGCSQIRLFDDSLPYLLERVSHIEHELDSENSSARNDDLEWEKQLLEHLIQDCHDDDEINAAARYRRKHSPLLPRDLSSLRVIFDEELADV
ncbi:hypothetical protein ACI2KS_23105 [Pseudomonas sp. NPDC087358]|uniref:hypothetical protein n=1 Tax=Pseudomonas sp. NPDC087358 TaxID=3364439 RepID=UPI00384B1AC7